MFYYGQDGSFLAEQLLEEGHAVIGMARRTSQRNLQNLSGVLGHPSFDLADGDVTDGPCMNRLIRQIRPDEIYNLAAQSFVAVSFTEPSHTFDVTAKGVLNILEAVRGLDYPCRVYQASTSEMFGRNVTYLLGDERFDGSWCEGINFEMWQDEETPFSPNSPYAVAKLAAHNLVRVYRESFGIFAVAGILMNHESERRGHEFVTRKITSWVGKAVVADRNNRPIPHLYLGNPEAYRDWGYAPDYMRAAVLMLRAEKPTDYVISTGYAHTIRSFLGAATHAGGLPLGFTDRHVTWKTDTMLRPCEVHYLRGRPERARKELGWEPKINLTQMIGKMVVNDISIAMKEAASP